MTSDEVASLLSRATNGDVEAQIDLAVRLATGDGIKKNEEAAFHWYTKAAEQYSPEALYNLGLMTHLGEGTEKDEKKANKLLLQAAECGSSDACLVIAEAYEEGSLNFPIDYEKSAMYYLRGTYLGSTKAMKQLGELLEKRHVSLEVFSKLIKNFEP